MRRLLAVLLVVFALTGCTASRIFIEFEPYPAPEPTPEPTAAPTAMPTPEPTPSQEPATPAPTVTPTPEPATPAPTPNPTPSLTITGIEVLEVTDTTARITWTCSEPANAWMEWGPDGVVVPDVSYPETNYPGETSLDYSTHIQSISGLTPETTYHYRVFCLVPDPVEPLIASAMVQ